MRLGNLLDGSFFWSIPWKVWPEENLKYFRHQENIFWALKSEFGDKKANFVSFELPYRY